MQLKLNHISALSGFDFKARFFGRFSRSGRVGVDGTRSRSRAIQSRARRAEGVPFDRVGAGTGLFGRVGAGTGLQTFGALGFQEFLDDRFHGNISVGISVLSNDHREPLEAFFF